MSKANNELIQYCINKDIMPESQAAIMEEMFGRYETFEKASAMESEKVLMAFRSEGHTIVTSRATRQVDINDDLFEEEKTPIKTNKGRSDDTVSSENAMVSFDDDTGTLIEKDENKANMARNLHRLIRDTTLMTSFCLTKMADEELYLQLGYSNMKEYVNYEIPFSYRTAQRYMEVGRSYGPLFPGITGAIGQSGETVSPGELDLPDSEYERYEKLSKVSFRKLKALAKSGADFSDVMSKDIITLQDGTEIDIEEMRAQTVKNFENELRDKRKKWLAQIEKSEERAKVAESERDQVKSENESLKDQNETLKEYRDKFEAVGVNLEAGKRKLKRIEGLLVDINAEIESMKMEEETCRLLRENIQAAHRRMDRLKMNFKDRHLAAFEIITDN